MAQEIICGRCGWRNEPTALMCGGCGQPVRSPTPVWDMTAQGVIPRPPATAPAPPRWDVAAAPPPYTPYTPYMHQPVGRPTRPVGRGRPARSNGGCGSALLTLLLVLAALVGIAAGAWGLVIRPMLHAQVDGAIAGKLDSAVAILPPIPDLALQVAGSQLTISDGEVNTVLQHAIPAGSGVDSMSVAFRPQRVLITYSAYGQSGTVQTTPQLQDGRLVVEDTQVQGILAWVETGSELQATVNRSLEQLSNKTPHGFQSVQTSSGTITVILKT